MAALPPALALQYTRRCREAVRQGGVPEKSSNPLGSWSMPVIILDENAYREEMIKFEEHRDL
eukprot:jgi/Mesen1/4123/ME000218S03237